ncbi:MAG: hypothetical protein IME98_03755, partial [Proteobacteria bacterium]|nr:hypothetical protein [Pseudomonadota bacterium]
SYPVRKYLTLSLVAVGIIIIAGFYYISSAPEKALVDDTSTSVAPLKEESVVAKVEKAKPAVEHKEVEPKLAVALKVESTVKAPAKIVVVQETVVEEIKEVPAFVTLPALTAEEFSKRGLTKGEHLLRANAKELTWMKVTIDYGEPFEVMLQPGERAEWKGKVFFCS